MKKITVVAAIIVEDQKILCVQRGFNKFPYISEKYEFPGGKIESGETNEQALIREILEELGITIELVSHFLTVEYEYPDFALLMYSYICKSNNTQDLILTEHIDFKWLSASNLIELNWAAADIPIVNSLQARFNEFT